MVIFINFGFNTYAAKYITDQSHKPKEINKIFSAILGIKLALFLLVVFLLLLGVYFIPTLRDHGALLLLLLGFALGEALFPIWFFQGKEKLGTPTKIVFTFKFLLVLFTLLLITASQDLIVYAVLLSSSQLLIGIGGLYIALRKFDTDLVRVPLHFAWKTIKEGFIFFIGSLFSKTFNLAVIFLVGIFFTMDDVASFDISFKIIAAFQIPFETLSMVLFPTISRSKNVKMNEKIVFLATAVSFIFWGFAYWQSDLLMTIMGGEAFLVYSPLLQNLSVLIPIVVITYFLGTNTLVAFGYHKEFNLSIILPSIFYILTLLTLWLLDSISIQTIIYSRIMVDALMMTFRMIIAVKHKLIFTSR